ncbi:MAG: Fe-S cluster assembly protein SufD [Alphaproteobacteria bacterium]
MPQTTTIGQPFLDRQAETGQGAGGRLAEVRRAGLARYGAVGLPTTRAEAWKYTTLNALRKIAFVPAALAASPPVVDALPAGRVLAVAGCRIVLVNGRMTPALSDLASLPAGVTVETLDAALERDWVRAALERAPEEPLEALNAAYAGDGVVIAVAAGAEVTLPLHLVSVGAAGTEPVMAHPRVVVALGRGARLTLLESQVGFGGTPYFGNTVVDVSLAEGAALGHYVLQNGADDASLIGSTRVVVERRAVYEAMILTVGGALCRNDLRVTLAGEGAECRVGGAYAADGHRHVDNTLMIDHAVPDTVSRQVFKGVLDGHARGVFQGRILVRRDAQRTDGRQVHKALLLSRTAEVDCKPELEIYADDVKCAHGATAGELDEDAMFYLRARGLDPETARGLLIEAFLDDVIDGIGVEAVREAMADVVRDWLARRGGRQA